MFNAIYVQNLRHAQFLQLMRFIEKVIFESGIESLIPLHTEFKSEVDQFEVKIKTSTKNPLTSQIHNMDDKRDTVYSCIVKLVEINALHSDTAIVDTAKMLLPVIETHGKNVPYLGLNEETAVLSSFISELETRPELTEAVDNIPGLKIWINDLKTYNTACEQLLLDRSISNIPTRSAKEIRISVYDLFKTIKNHITAHITLNSEGNYLVLKEEINEQIKNTD
ncbi:MAG: DUF6261 family protein [Flavobacteriales bacterium]